MIKKISSNDDDWIKEYINWTSSRTDLTDKSRKGPMIGLVLQRSHIVTGDDAHPFYLWASNELGLLAKPRWNFHKYLVGTNGQLVDWFSTPTSPTSGKITKAIENHLSKTFLEDK